MIYNDMKFRLDFKQVAVINLFNNCFVNCLLHILCSNDS